MSAMSIYWLLKLDDIQTIFCFIALIMFIISVICFVDAGMKNDDENPDKKSIQKSVNRGFVFISLSLFSFICYKMTPSTKQMAIIYVTPKIINNEKVQQIPSKILNLTNDWLDELSPEKMLKKDSSDTSK